MALEHGLPISTRPCSLMQLSTSVSFSWPVYKRIDYIHNKLYPFRGTTESAGMGTLGQAVTCTLACPPLPLELAGSKANYVQNIHRISPDSLSLSPAALAWHRDSVSITRASQCDTARHGGGFSRTSRDPC